jgi:hypothetical protein
MHGLNPRLWALPPQRLRLALPGRLRIRLPGAPQAHIASLAALAPGGHPAGVGFRAFPALLDLLHLPYRQVLQPGLELEGLGLCQGLICFFL